MKQWLVTGGAGFIGSNLAHELLARGERVRVVDNLISGRRQNLEAVRADLEFLEGDLRDPDLCRRAVKDVDLILHQAALGSVPRSVKDPVATNDHNVNGALNLFVAARDAGVRRIVCASSSSIYGKNLTLPKREDLVPMPISPYAVSKLAQERYCLVFNEVYGLEAVALRYFNIYGPRQDPGSAYAAVIPLFIKAAMTEQPPLILGDGEQTRDFTFVADCVAANLLAAEVKAAGGGVFNIAGGRQVTVNTLWATIKRLTGAKVDAVHLEARAGDVRHSLADVSLAQNGLGWAPRVPLESGLERTIAWMRTEP